MNQETWGEKDVELICIFLLDVLMDSDFYLVVQS